MSSYIPLFFLAGSLAHAQTGNWRTQFSTAPEQQAPVAGRITAGQSDQALQVFDDTNLARNALARGEAEPARAYVQDALDTILEIQYETANPVNFISVSNQISSGNLVNVAMDLNLQQESLESVRSELESGNLKAAAQALAAARDAVMNVTVSSDNPLLRAGLSLAEARGLVENGHRHQARMSLEQAAGALYDYRAISPAHAKDARTLSRQIRYLAANLSDLNPAAVQQIDQWQNLVAYWGFQHRAPLP